MEDPRDPTEIRDELIQYENKRVIYDAEKVICKNQIIVAVTRADRAEEQGVMIANNWGVEVLLHMSATHQISDAIDLLGITEETTTIGIVQDTEKLEFSAKTGFPKFISDHKLLKRYDLPGLKDPCTEIISKGVRNIIDHQ